MTVLLAAVVVVGCTGPAPSAQRAPVTARPATSAGPGSSSTPPAPSTTTTEPPQLPRGGRELFPRYRLVGFAGHPTAPALGRLGIGNLGDRAREIEKVAQPYAAGREILPVLELIATVVQGSPGRDGMYRVRESDDVIATYLAAARKVKGVLLLDIQPGRSAFLTEVKAYEKWLKQPDVGVALDPEWRMGPGQIPMRVYGHVSGKELDSVARYLAGIVKAGDLPDKAMVFHQVAASVVRGQDAIKEHPGVVIIKSVDGIGSKAMKEDTYNVLVKDLPKGIHPGFKLFYEEDRRLGPLMTPQQVLALKPRPEYVLYE